MINIGINGFGRIGRAITKILLDNPDFKVAEVNDIDQDINNHAYLLKYDSIYGKLDRKIAGNTQEKKLFIDKSPIQFHAFQSTLDIPWDKETQIVIDATGIKDNALNSSKLISNSNIEKVLITSAPNEGTDFTLIFGVNDNEYQPKNHHVISTATCDAIAVAPIVTALKSVFGIEHGYITTLHPWLSYQNLMDGTLRSVSNPSHSWNDYALGRAANRSLIPKQTTLIDIISQSDKKLVKGLDAISFRVPTEIVSAADISLNLLSRISTKELSEFLISLANVTCPPKTDPDTMLVFGHLEVQDGTKTKLHTRNNHHETSGSRDTAFTGAHSQRSQPNLGDQRTDLLSLAQRIRGDECV